MKRFLTIFCVSILLSVLSVSSAEAQSGAPVLPNRIRASYGDAFYTLFGFNLFHIMFGGAFTNHPELITGGCYSLGYRRLSESGRWSYGGSFTYFGTRRESQKGFFSDDHFFMIMPGVDFNYIKSGIFRLYGTAEAGIIFSSHFASYAFQINPIAVRLGNDRIGFFVEAGAGMKGIFNAGFEVGF